MKKKELIELLNTIANQASDLSSYLEDAKYNAQRLVSLIEDLPSEAEEIEDDEEKEE